MTHIQKAVEAIGDKGTYQKILMGFLILCYIELGLMLFGSTFVFMNPIFDCPGLDNPSEDDACPIIDTCTLKNPYTATGYANLYCDKSTSRNIVQSAIYIGSIIGLLVLTPFADQKGNKKVFLIAIAICILGLLLDVIGVYTEITAIMVIGQICIGAGSYCILITGYVILGALSEDKFKQIGIITLNAVWAIGEVMIGILYYWYNEWFNYLILFLMIPMVGLLIFGSFFLIESPFYLIQKEKNVKKALKAMEQVALINNTNMGKMAEVQSNFLLALKEIEEKERQSNSHQASKFAIFKDFKYLRILLLVAVCEVAINSFYYGIQFSLGKVGTDFGSNIILMGIVQFAAFFTLNFIITKLPRKKGTILFNGLSLVLGLLFLIDMPSIAQTVILGFGRWVNAWAMGIIPMLQSEPFPHKYRSSVWGYIEGISQLGNFITPYIVTACDNANFPTLVVTGALCAVFGILPMCFIKETLGRSEDEIKSEDLQASCLSVQKDQKNQETEKPLMT